MKRAVAWLPYTALAGRRWIVGAWLVELAALAAITLWVDMPWLAIDLAIAAVVIPAFGCWVAPLGSLLAQRRAARELCLPREGRGLAVCLGLCLALNLLPAAGVIYALAQDHAGRSTGPWWSCASCWPNRS